MEHLSFILGILIYSVALINLLVLINLWKKNSEHGLFWTLILMGSLTGILVFQLIYNYLQATELNSQIITGVLNILDIASGLLTLSLVYTIPRFSVSMAGLTKWRGWTSQLIKSFCILLAALFLLAFFHSSQLRSFFNNLIFFSLTLCLFITLTTVLYISARDKNEDTEQHPWYLELSVSMAKWGLAFLPLFIWLDFYPGPFPFQWMQVLHDHFSAVPYYLIFWNIRLLKTAFSQIAHLPETTPEGTVIDWLQESGLTKREIEVAQLLIEGKNYAEICDLLFLSQATVKSHTNRLYRKTGTANQIALIKEASRYS